MDNCIFCKIISGEIPSSKVYEDDKVLAFLDISQATKGHTLVIPKEHVRNILEMSAGTAETIFSRVPKIARAVQKATGAIGMNILNNCLPCSYSSRSSLRCRRWYPHGI